MVGLVRRRQEATRVPVATNRRQLALSSHRWHNATDNPTNPTSILTVVIVEMFFNLTVCSGLVLLYLTYAFWTWRRLSHIPGPLWAAVSKFWIIREGFLGRQPTALRDVTNKYGAYDQLMRPDTARD